MKWCVFLIKLIIVLQSVGIVILLRTILTVRLKSKTETADERNTHSTVWDVAKINVRQSDYHYTTHPTSAYSIIYPKCMIPIHIFWLKIDTIINNDGFVCFRTVKTGIYWYNSTWEELCYQWFLFLFQNLPSGPAACFWARVTRA